MKKIPRQLEVQPELRLDAEKLFEAESGVGAYSAARVDQLVHSWVGDAEPFGKLSLGQMQGFEEIGPDHLARVSGRTVCRNANHSVTSVVIHNLDCLGACRRPTEADPELIVDTNAVLTGPLALECLEPIAGRDPQRLEPCRRVDLVELPVCLVP